MASKFISLDHFKLNRLEKLMAASSDYQEWREYALQHDRLSGADRWKDADTSSMYDFNQIQRRHDRLKQYKDAGKSQEVLFALNEGLHGNMGGMGKTALYERSKLGTKTLIEEYTSLICDSLQMVEDAPESEISYAEKLDFFRRASHCYGRSALLLSGGGGYTYYHSGVASALIQANLLPKVISGSSAGAWASAILGTRTDTELKESFHQHRYVEKGISGSDLLSVLRGEGKLKAFMSERLFDGTADLENITFQEAFEHTGRFINISIAPAERHQNSRLMSAITSPNVTLASAVRASAAIPGLFKAVQLEAKDSNGKLKPYLPNRYWVDGSFGEDLPIKRLSRLYGVNHYIVSMINPVAMLMQQAAKKTAPDSIFKSTNAVVLKTFHEFIKTMRRIASPMSMNVSDAVLGTIDNLVDQQYSGDINFVLDSKHLKPRYALFDYKEDEPEKLVLAGQRDVWKRLDQVRNATIVSHVIDDILTRLEHSSRSESALAQVHMVL